MSFTYIKTRGFISYMKQMLIKHACIIKCNLPLLIKTAKTIISESIKKSPKRTNIGIASYICK